MNIIMVVFYIGLDCMYNNFIMLSLCFMLKKKSINVVILLICACCLYIIMVILYTSLDFMHNTFIIKYVRLILKMDPCYYLQNGPNLIKGSEPSKGTLDFVFVFEHSIIF